MQYMYVCNSLTYTHCVRCDLCESESSEYLNVSTFSWGFDVSPQKGTKVCVVKKIEYWTIDCHLPTYHIRLTCKQTHIHMTTMTPSTFNISGGSLHEGTSIAKMLKAERKGKDKAKAHAVEAALLTEVAQCVQGVDDKASRTLGVVEEIKAEVDVLNKFIMSMQQQQHQASRQRGGLVNLITSGVRTLFMYAFYVAMLAYIVNMIWMWVVVAPNASSHHQGSFFVPSPHHHHTGKDATTTTQIYAHAREHRGKSTTKYSPVKL
jgi:hypothetical protein